MDLSKKVANITAEERSFVPQGETEPIVYKRLNIVVTLKGEPAEVYLKLTNDQYNVLRLADENPKIEVKEG